MLVKGLAKGGWFFYYTKANTTTVRSWMKRSSLTEGETVRNKYPDRKVGDIYFEVAR